MLFGSISYLNLLPFQVFLKRYIKSNAEKMSFRYKRAVPSKINKALQRKEVNAAFISSIASAKCKCTDLGIIADQKVYSVLLLEGENEIDPASATSNQLARVLELQGKVLIGDVALKHYFDEGTGIDLAEAWYKKTALPFVFARLCYNRHEQAIQKLARSFCTNPGKDSSIYSQKRSKKKRYHAKSTDMVFAAYPL